MKLGTAARVTKILISSIEPNPHNPRRLFDDKPMAILEESIKKLGVLVPITVYPQSEGKIDLSKSRFVILDGERRWRCCADLRMQKIPAIIVERPSEAENILTMFHIHNLREGWQLMPTALKLEILIKQLKQRNERKLAFLTKLSIGQVRRCKILLTYPKKHQNLMLAPPSERLKTDFFIELDRIRRPALKEKFPPWVSRGDSKCIDLILDKYLRKKIKAVTEFRNLAEIYRVSVKLRKREQFYNALDRFLADEDSDIDSIYVPGASFAKETKEAAKSASRLETQLKSLEPVAVASNEDLISSLTRLLKLIQKKMDEAMLSVKSGDRQ